MTVLPERAVTDAAQLLLRRVGLRLDPSTRGRLSRSVAEEAAARGLDLPTYVDSLDTNSAALQDLLNRVTVQETAFFRDPAQFDALARHVLPTLEDPVTIWSAGCANGQEPYSIAMLLNELGRADSRVCATDLSTQALDRTRRARYSARETAGLSAARRHRYLVAADDQFEIVPEIRAHVEVAFQNLAIDPPPVPSGTCPVVLCRNVLIYFSHEEVIRFLDRIADWLPPDGWLFLGYSESLWQVTERFQLVRLGDAFVYRRRDVRLPQTNKAARSQSRPATATRVERRAPNNDAKRVAREPVPDSSASTSRPQLDALLAEGEAAIGAGDLTTAVATFRKSVYLDPDQPITHLHLGLALEASGDPVAARRAFAAARDALARCDTATIEAVLEGYQIDELARLLDRKVVNTP